MLSKLVTSNARIFGRQFLSKRMINTPRYFSTTSLAQKGKGEEEKFFRQEEESAKARLKAQFEKMLESNKESDKEELLHILGKDDKPVGFLARNGLNNPGIIGGVAIILGMPFITNEIIILNEEVMLLGVFMISISLLHNIISPIYGNLIDENTKKTKELYEKADEKLKFELTESVKANEKCIGMESTITDVFALTDNLAVAQADLLNNIEQHKFRDVIAKKLDSLVAIDEAASAAIRKRMLTKVRGEVMSTFETDKKIKESALMQAISVLQAGTSSKLGKDVVGEVFQKSIAAYREEYSKLPPGKDEILNQVEKDVAALLHIPKFETLADAGNVYVSHPLPGLMKA